jgi:NAD(P)-dependent dehydrogenase (short-subunit alcohol dehydrogenase family)
VKRSAVVTGCGQGIGRAIAARLTMDDWVVVGLELDPKLAAKAERSLGLAGLVTADVSDPGSHAEAAALADDLAPLGGWVNNAGIVPETPLHDPDPAIVERTIAVNLLGTFWGCSAAVRTFLGRQQGGSIVSVSSIHGRRAVRPGTAVYDASKAGIDAITRFVAAAYGENGIRANAVAPGGVRTPLFERYAAAATEPEALEREAARSHPLARMAEPEEIASVVAFLLGEEASFVTGTSVSVDGGLAARVQPFPSGSG